MNESSFGIILDSVYDRDSANKAILSQDIDTREYIVSYVRGEDDRVRYKVYSDEGDARVGYKESVDWRIYK